MSVAKRSSPPVRIDARESLDHARDHNAPLVVASFWPGVGIKDENPRKEAVRGGLDQRLGVAAAQPHVGELFALEAGERRDDAVEKRLAADDADIRVGLRLLNQMLPRAEADLEPDFARRRGESPPRRQRFRT